MLSRYHFARLFVDCPSVSDVVESLRANGLLADEVAELEPRSNDDPGDGFLGYPVTVEVEPYAADDPRMTATVQRAVRCLRACGWRTVVAADFEDEIDYPGHPAAAFAVERVFPVTGRPGGVLWGTVSGVLYAGDRIVLCRNGSRHLGTLVAIEFHRPSHAGEDQHGIVVDGLGVSVDAGDVLEVIDREVR
ncbi:hypothetical protein EV193_115141 [Herbihabitans rhizosphaerae]|uniref:Uncharacterized protein n=1 Tax=Herbihabitans rhizosphaerae TaxID=1872711 RepID=A0A4Q7KGH3_9PSEU|nr:hypothetical protein [Herbihabitans rhizosphaerae]RZS31262.1 hypothetical protein EV193_115141 [Herbihabitans rhizosphaerae]